MDPSSPSSPPLSASVDARAQWLGALVGSRPLVQGVSLIGAQGPLAVFELPDEAQGLVILGHEAVAPDELRRRLDRILGAHQAGVLFLLLVGGGPAARETLIAADRAAPDPNRLGIYHADENGQLTHVAGRRLALLRRLSRTLDRATPVTAPDLEAALERGARDRAEAVAFAQRLRTRRPWVTWVLIAACVILYALATQWGNQRFGLALLLMGANSGWLVQQGDVWRLLSYAFVHGEHPAHLVLNMLALQSFGGFLEPLLGPRRYLVVYTAAALGGGLASAFLSGALLSVGASGALSGLMTAGFALLLRRQSLVPARVAFRLRRRLFTVLILNALISFVPGIDLFAHLGGAVVGFALGASGPFTKARPELRHDGVGLGIGAAIAALALAGSVAFALANGRPWTIPKKERGGEYPIDPAAWPGTHASRARAA